MVFPLPLLISPRLLSSSAFALFSSTFLSCSLLSSSPPVHTSPLLIYRFPLCYSASFFLFLLPFLYYHPHFYESVYYSAVVGPDWVNPQQGGSTSSVTFPYKTQTDTSRLLKLKLPKKKATARSLWHNLRKHINKTCRGPKQCCAKLRLQFLTKIKITLRKPNLNVLKACLSPVKANSAVEL